MAKNKIRRSLLAIIDPHPSKKEIDLLWDYFKSSCAYCGKDILRESRTGHADHVVSSSAGGNNSIYNHVLACALCNGDDKREEAWQSFLARTAIDKIVAEERHLHITNWLARRPVIDQLELQQQVASIINHALENFDSAVTQLRNLRKPIDNETLLLKGDELFDGGHYTQAFNLYLEGANAGCAHSMLRLASMYTSGEGVSCDYDEAIEWELKAVAAGEPIALLNLGITYRIKGDIINAKHWFEKSIAAGDGSGALQLAKLYLVSNKETSKVSEYLHLAINADNMCESDIEEAQQLLSQLKKL